jgi:SAM-dependent methyltransferase
MSEELQTMSDFREPVYERYVTLHGANISSKADDSSFRWKKKKYLPLLAGIPNDAAVLEIGCGGGATLSLLKQEGFINLLGVDISAEQVQLGIARNLQIVQGDAMELLRENPNSFKLIMAFDLLEHFQKDEQMKLVSAIYKALTPGGRFVGQTPNAAGLFPRQVMYDDLTHLSFLTPTSARQLFTLHGFSNLQFLETGPAVIGPISFVRLALWKIVREIASIVRMIETGKREQIWTENFLFSCEKVISS